MNDQPGEDLGAQGVEVELERGHHAEVAAAALDRPKQIGVLRRAGRHQLPLGVDHVGRAEVVSGQPVLPAEPAEPAAQRQPGHAGGGVDPGGGGQSEGLGLVVQVPEGHAGVDPSPAAVGIDVDRAHPRQIDHHAPIADGAPRDVVTGALDRHQQAVFTAKAHRLHHVGDAAATHDQRRVAIDHRVPNGSGLIISWRLWCDDLPTDPPRQLIEGCAGERLVAPVERSDYDFIHGSFPFIAGVPPRRQRSNTCKPNGPATPIPLQKRPYLPRLS